LRDFDLWLFRSAETKEVTKVFGPLVSRPDLGAASLAFDG
jgi:hypothetical protein